jgi:uncharacterized repeat protein (TIGR03806 family)
MKKIALFTLSFGIFALSAFHQKADNQLVMPNQKLSDYHFFEENLSNQKPTSGVIPYSLNTPLFSDFAEKLRFIKLPENVTVEYNDKEVFDFPVGTTIIKTFYFPNDFRDEKKGRKLIETRLLIHENEGWKALEYVWNEAQTDAFLEVAGDTKEVSYIYADGKKKKHNYTIPNLNQCKGCHNRNEVLTPIGPSARQLNGVDSRKSIVSSDLQSADNQLVTWSKLGILKNLPDLKDVPKAPIWNKPETGTLEERARIWLDINCGHCHRPEGPASTSGLNLSIHNQNLTTLGIMKTPVAAGRASGNLLYDIVPKKPEESILIYRLNSTDPGIRMPEVGRNTVHKESVEMLKEWIKSMNHD